MSLRIGLSGASSKAKVALLKLSAPLSSAGPARVLRAGDGVDRVHDLEVPVHGGLGGEGHGQQHAAELHRGGDDGRGGEERHEGADAELAAGGQQDADDEPGAEGEFGQERHDQAEGGQVLGLGDLGLPELLGLFVEVRQGLAAAAEGLQHADAVDRLLDRGGEVPGLVLAAAGHLAEAGPEPEAVDHDGHGGGQEDQGQLPAHREHHDDADHHGQGGDHEHDGAERHPAAEEVQVRHGAGEQLPGAPAVVEGDREVLEVAVEGDPHPGFHGGGRVDDELAAQRHEAGLGDAQAQDDQRGGPHRLRCFRRAGGTR